MKQQMKRLLCPTSTSGGGQQRGGKDVNLVFP